MPSLSPEPDQSTFRLNSIIPGFSFNSDPSSMRRKSNSTCDNTVDELNRKLSVERSSPQVGNDQHLFFGPPSQKVDTKEQPVPVLHGERKLKKDKVSAWLDSEPQDEEISTRSQGNSRLQAAGRYFGNKVMTLAANYGVKCSSSFDAFVNPDSFCDGCGMDPIIGVMYTCSKCDNYCLCQKCYRKGIHGFENSTLLKTLREDYAVANVAELCKNRVPEEVFILLMKHVCRGQIDKFKFLVL
jgi:hypothetical protein